MKTYGIPYQGSKSRILKHIAPLFPKADHFYDLFGGGFSVTHYLLLNRPNDFKQFHFNEINTGLVQLITETIGGRFNDFKPEFVSREDFFAKKDTDAYIKYVWSFGNNGRGYLYGKKIEAYKKSMHNAVVFGVFDELSAEVLSFDKWPNELISIKDRRLYLRGKIEAYRKTKLPEVLAPYLNPQQLQQLERLQRLEQLERLQQLQQLQGLQQLQQLKGLEFYAFDYQTISIKENSIVYCDIPYKGCAGYNKSGFDYARFFDWAAKQSCPVYISEYNIDDDRFHLIKEIETNSRIASKGPVARTERVYVNHAGWENLKCQI